LIKDKTKRLGAVNDAEEILKHKFFKGINKTKMLENKYIAPYLPTKD